MEKTNIEKEILNFWKEQEIYRKVKEKNLKGKKFYLMDGPPYANGHIHIGTALNKSLKDIAMRFKRMQGFDVFDRPGYDTHGLPIEFQVEKEIGSKGKKDIEEYGVSKFIDKCKEFATQYIGKMNEEFSNLGVWMDWDNPYLTLSDEYIEAIWAAFKKAEEKGLLYLGKYPVHVCTRCGTAVAYNEIEYGKQKDTSIYVKFPLRERKNSYLIIWTTTPWTLPANTGVMVHPEVDYQEIETIEGERWIIAKALVPSIMAKLERGFTLKKEFKGKEMKGWKYFNPLSKNLNLDVKKGYEVVLSPRYVTTEDGTALVHCAPGHGKEDYEVGKEYGLDMPCPVEINGLMNDKTGKYSGKKAREVDAEIIKDLQEDGFLVLKMEYEHDYPLCWRDKSPLIMISQPQWFFKISEIQKELLKDNDKTEWIPNWVGLRMKAWLNGLGDWPVSRQRYWGTPLPIWQNNETGERVIIGSIKELKKLSGKENISLHKPEIDKIEINGKKGILKRVPEVLDVWFDSGVSSWAALGYPSKKDQFKRYWPADLNIEGKDQIRGWWNSQMILSRITFDKKPFETIMEHGMVLSVGKVKMSKSLGNTLDPQQIIDKYSRDYMRYYFAKVSKGEDMEFREDDFKEIEKFVMMINNIENFISQLSPQQGEESIEDLWIMSKYNSLIREVTKDYSDYRFFDALAKIENFVLQDLSRGYIKLIRDRADETRTILEEIMDGVVKMLNPVMPFLMESKWQKKRAENKNKEESINLSSWPKFETKKINPELEKDFENAYRLIEIGMAIRDKEKIGLRWPLAEAKIFHPEKIGNEVAALISSQLNVKKISIKNGKEPSVSFDLNISPELEAEGFAREISRRVQAERKNKGFRKGQLVDIKLKCPIGFKKILEINLDSLKERTNAKTLLIEEKNDLTNNVFTIKERQFSVDFL